jgi:hypothetical protein
MEGWECSNKRGCESKVQQELHRWYYRCGSSMLRAIDFDQTLLFPSTPQAWGTLIRTSCDQRHELTCLYKSSTYAMINDTNSLVYINPQVQYWKTSLWIGCTKLHLLHCLLLIFTNSMFGCTKLHLLHCLLLIEANCLNAIEWNSQKRRGL